MLGFLVKSDALLAVAPATVEGRQWFHSVARTHSGLAQVSRTSAVSGGWIEACMWRAGAVWLHDGDSIWVKCWLNTSVLYCGGLQATRASRVSLP